MLRLFSWRSTLQHAPSLFTFAPLLTTPSVVYLPESKALDVFPEFISANALSQMFQ